MEDPYYYDDDDEPGFNLGRFILNVLTFLILVATLTMVAGFTYIFFVPQSDVNPFPPPTLPPTLGPPTPTNTPAILLPTEQPPTSSPRPLPTDVPTEAPPTAVPTATEEPPGEPSAQFELQEGSPSATGDERGCAYLGVGGYVFDQSELPITGLTIRIGGELAGAPIGPNDILSGNAADRLGQGGYYYQLAAEPTASQGTVWVQVVDSSSRLPISEQVFFDTTASCDANLIFVSFNEVVP